MIEIKPCKGHGKAKGCGCGKDVEVKKRKYGLCPVCFWDWMQTSVAGQEYYKSRFIPRVEKEAKKTIKRKDKEAKESLKSVQRLIQEARVPFQKWIRFRDANEGCISCPTTTAKIWHAGHYKKAELFTGLIFNEMNVNKQCEKCNTFLNGNESEYRKGLVKKYGEERVKQLEESADQLRLYKWDKEEIRNIKKKYHQKLKQ